MGRGHNGVKPERSVVELAANQLNPFGASGVAAATTAQLPSFTGLLQQNVTGRAWYSLPECSQCTDPLRGRRAENVFFRAQALARMFREPHRKHQMHFEAGEGSRAEMFFWLPEAFLAQRPRRLSHHTTWSHRNAVAAVAAAVAMARWIRGCQLGTLGAEARALED
mmetsp:Transcript_136586/g.354070  ORF Transcript_136586/g.354070 Transcript_136586/m.354070 type:complete len:166 (-) Transcript_136586:190-687(-)